MDHSKFISKNSQARNPSAIRALMPYLNNKEMISLGAGQPNPATFPFASLTLTLKTGETIEVDSQLFDRALSYDLTSGQPLLNQWLTELQKKEHAPPQDFKLSVGSGSQDLLTKASKQRCASALEMLLDPDDALLIEGPTYTGALSFLETVPCTLAEVATDEHGIVPESLRDMLARWPESNPNGRKDQARPHVLYTIPCGGNPTGVNATLARKQAVYAICSEYDVAILEDDAYYYLQFDNERIRSYLSMDIDGRVLRCDSMSKILSSGLRLGWLTGPAAWVERINMHTMVTNLQPSGVSQVMALALLQHWGHAGFFEHVQRVAAFYREKRDDFLYYLHKHMAGKATWALPGAGMFFWLQLLHVSDSHDLVMNKALKENVLAVPGVAFMPNKNKNSFLRLSYSCVEKADMDEGLRRLANVIDRERKQ
ncbi:pyridoxal phosphate-dependent transferase [Sporodiniella umbellata]|nr:pyridoxal phosphate-dependent transferase [Sporodiniella umbellata]